MKNAPLDVGSLKKGHLEIELLGEHIATQAAHLDAATHRLLTDIRAFDQAGGWFRQGARSCAAWLSWRIGWDGRTARDRVRVAGRLGELPLVDEALRRAELSYSKVRAICRVATPEIEAILVDYARYTTGAQLEKICRMFASVVGSDDDTKPADDLARRTLRWRELEDGMVRLEVTLHRDDAALVKEAIERVAAERCRQSGSAEPVAAAAAPSGSTVAGAAAAHSGSAEPAVGAAAAPNGSTVAGAAAAQSGTAEPVVGLASRSGSAEPIVTMGMKCEVRSVVTIDAKVAASAPNGLGKPSGSVEPLGDESGCTELGAGEPDVDYDDFEEIDSGSAEPRSGSNATPAPTASGPSAGLIRAREMREAAIQNTFDRAGALVAMAQDIVRGTAKQRSPISLVLTSTLETLLGHPNPVAGDQRQAGDVGVLPDGVCISAAATRRLACDCAVTRVVEDEHGNPHSISARFRRIPGAMKAALLRIDQTCRYPGCNAKAFLEGHHVEHWAEGGPTEIPNLLCMCGWHHRFVHEYGFEISMDAARNVTVTDPLGRKIVDVPTRHVGPIVGTPLIQAANGNLSITAETTACGWNGEPIDYPACVDGLLAPERKRLRNERSHRA